jgi:hypothetical protein
MRQSCDKKILKNKYGASYISSSSVTALQVVQRFTVLPSSWLSRS